MNTTKKPFSTKPISPQSNESSNSLGIRGRMFVGFGAIVLTLLIAMIIILMKITSVERVSEVVYQSSLPTYEAYLTVNGKLYDSQAALEGFLLTHDPAF